LSNLKKKIQNPRSTMTFVGI